jgi:NAD(P)-dependent dehydrogenase (short-subunit alcohol dehydrogenase family)
MPIDCNLDGNFAVVTGGSKGIGRAIALRLAKEGARVLISARDQSQLDATVSELNAIRPGCIGMAGDVRSESDVCRMADMAERQFAAVDILVNNAGLYPVTPLSQLSLAEWDSVIGTNLTGSFLCARTFADLMVRKKTRGRIVNVSSTASVLARPGIAHYASSKAGLSMLTRVLAVELAPAGITVNAVCPGVIGTETVLAAARKPELKAEHEAKLRRIPLGRLGEPDEVASAVAFLVSNEARYITGATLFVDGGFTLGIPSY